PVADDAIVIAPHEDPVPRQIEQLGLLAQPRLGLLAVAEIAHDRREQPPIPDGQRAEADLDRKLAPVLAPAEEREPGAHWPGPGRGDVADAVREMRFSVTLGEENLDGLPDQLRPSVAEP